MHETITAKALESVQERLGADIDKEFVKALKGNKGVRYPDMPEGLIKLALDVHKKGTLSYESHYGEKQFWHSMAYPGADTADKVRGKIFEQAAEWYDTAAAAWDRDDLKTAGQFMGRLLHMVQDSYSKSHTQRGEGGVIVGFQAYDAQDPKKHAKADEPSKGDPEDYEDLEKYLPGAKEAMVVTVDLLEFFLRGEKAGFFEKMEEIYTLAPNAYPREGGPRTEERYKADSENK